MRSGAFRLRYETPSLTSSSMYEHRYSSESRRRTEEQSRNTKKRSERQINGERTYTYHKATTLACSTTPTLSQLTKASRRLDMIKPKARLLLEQQRAQIIMTDTRKRSHPPLPPPPPHFFPKTSCLVFISFKIDTGGSKKPVDVSSSVPKCQQFVVEDLSCSPLTAFAIRPIG